MRCMDDNAKSVYNDYTTAQEAAARFEVGIDCIYKAARRGKVQTIEPQPRLFSIADLERHFAKKEG